MTGPCRAELYEDADGSCPVEKWFNELNDTKYAAMSAAIKHLLERQGIGTSTATE